MDLSQHCLQLPQLFPCSGAGQDLPSPLVTVDVHGQNLTGPWSIMCDDILIIKLGGIVAGLITFKNCASRVGIQCLVSGVRLHTSNILSKCFKLWMSPESCHLNQSWPLMSCTMASTHCGCSSALQSALQRLLYIVKSISTLQGIAARAYAAWDLHQLGASLTRLPPAGCELVRASSTASTGRQLFLLLLFLT